MRRIAIINQKGGVGKTTTATNLGAALALAGRRVVVVDMDPQANLSLYLGCEERRGDSTIYGVLTGGLAFGEGIRATRTPGLWLVPSHIDLSGAELELAATIGRETVLRDALESWEAEGALVADRNGELGPVDYLLLDCPPSLGLLSINALAAAYEVLIAVQTEFFALQGLGKLVEVVQLLKRRLNPSLELTGLLPSLYDNRLRLAREVLAELRRFFPGKVYQSSIRSNVKLAESPSHSLTIFEYAPESNGAKDYAGLAEEVMGQEEAPLTPAAEDEELLAAAQALREVELPSVGEEAAAQPEPKPEPEPEPLPDQETEAEAEPLIELEPTAPPEPEPAPEPCETLEAPEPAAEPPHGPAPEPPQERPDEATLPFGVIVPPGPNSRVEFRPATRPSSAPSGEEQPTTSTAVLEPEDEPEPSPEPELEPEALVPEPQPEPQPAAEAQPDPTPDPTPEPEPPQAPKALPVYGFGRYLGEDHARMPGPGGPRQ